MANSTTVIEMAAIASSKDQPILLQTPINGSSELPAPVVSNVVEIKPTWNRPRINTYRLAAIFFGFIDFGMNDGSYGALIPYVGTYQAADLTVNTD